MRSRTPKVQGQHLAAPCGDTSKCDTRELITHCTRIIHPSCIPHHLPVSMLSTGTSSQQRLRAKQKYNYNIHACNCDQRTVTALLCGPNRLRGEVLTVRGRSMLSFWGRSRRSCRASSVCRISSSYHFVLPSLVPYRPRLVSLVSISHICDCYSVISPSLSRQIDPDHTE
jgi:hypothetical protein